MDNIEIVGYMASFFVAVSLSMSNMTHLRLINLMGALLFVLYGVAIEAWPVVATNAYIAVMNMYFLNKLK